MADQISDRFQCIFIHVPRTAGSSIEASSLFDDQRALTGKYVGGHKTAAAFKRDDPSRFDAYFTFTFVRNPYARLVSAYFWLARTGSGNTRDRALFERFFEGKTIDFMAFCRERLSRKLMGEIPHFLPQYTFVCNAQSEIQVDFVGRQESFKRDTKTVFKKLGAPYEYRHQSRSRHKHPSFYYTDDTQAKVMELYREDFELFGYSTDLEKGSNLRYQIGQGVAVAESAVATISRKTTSRP